MKNSDVENDVIVKDADNCETENVNPLKKLVSATDKNDKRDKRCE